MLTWSRVKGEIYTYVRTYVGQLNLLGVCFCFHRATVCANRCIKKRESFSISKVSALMFFVAPALATNCGLWVWPNAMGVVGVTGIIWLLPSLYLQRLICDYKQ